MEGKQKAHSHKSISDASIMKLFLFPTLILLVLVNIFPLFWSLILSFTDYSAYLKPAPRWVGIKNYLTILTDQRFREQFSTTAYYVIVVVGVELVLGFLIAYLLNRKFRARAIYVTILAIPMMMSPALVGTLWKLIYNPSWGILNWALNLGVTDWISNPKLNIYSVMIVDVWMWTPFVMILSVAGLSAIPDYLYEAAEIDRASAWFKFWHITVPIASPLLIIALIFRTMEAFKTFDIAMGITGIGATSPKLLALRLYDNAFYRWDTGLSCAMAYVLLFIVIAVSSLYIRFLNALRK